MISDGDSQAAVFIEHSEAQSYVRPDTAPDWYFVLQPRRQCAVGYKYCADVLSL